MKTSRPPIVIDENILGYLIPEMEKEGLEWAGILRASPLKGATYTDLDGPIPLHGCKVRAATLADFSKNTESLQPAIFKGNRTKEQGFSFENSSDLKKEDPKMRSQITNLLTIVTLGPKGERETRSISVEITEEIQRFWARIQAPSGTANPWEEMEIPSEILVRRDLQAIEEFLQDNLLGLSDWLKTHLIGLRHDPSGLMDFTLDPSFREAQNHLDN